MNKKHKILKTLVSFLDTETVIKKIVLLARKNKNFTVAPVASHPLVEAYFNKKLEQCLNSFDLVLPDGKSLILAEKFLYGVNSQRVYGPELFQRLIKECESEKIKILLYGNHTEKIKKKLKERYSKLKIISFKDLKLKKINRDDINNLINQLKKYKSCILCLGIGSPAQHFLMSKLKKINMPIVAFGATFDFIAGVKKQAPNWMGKLGIEWLFRLINEPQRLWKRYLILSPLFILLVIFQKIKNDRVFNNNTCI